MRKETIPIILIADQNFIMQTAVTLTSMLLNKNESSTYAVSVLLAGCEETARLQSFNRETFQVRLLPVSLDVYQDIHQLGHITTAGLLKFNISELFPEYDKVLYLDSDVIIRGDLSELYSADLGGNYIAGVKELVCLRNGSEQINSGVLLLNTRLMREKQVSELLWRTRRSLGDRPSMDQQSFNLVCRGRTLFLEIKYNCIPSKVLGMEGITYEPGQLNSLYGTGYRSVEEAVESALILHYASANKPWRYTCVACGEEWCGYYRQSPYRGIPLRRVGKIGRKLYKLRERWKREGLRGVIQLSMDRAGLILPGRKSGRGDDEWG